MSHSDAQLRILVQVRDTGSIYVREYYHQTPFPYLSLEPVATIKGPPDAPFHLQPSSVYADIWRDRPASPTPLGRAWTLSSLPLIYLDNDVPCGHLATRSQWSLSHRSTVQCHLATQCT